MIVFEWIIGILLVAVLLAQAAKRIGAPYPALLALGVEAAGLEPARQQRIGSAEYVGRDRNGRPLKVRVLGRDAQDTQRLSAQAEALRTDLDGLRAAVASAATRPPVAHAPKSAAVAPQKKGSGRKPAPPPQAEAPPVK